MYNILVCDDDKDIVHALSLYLTAEGYRVIEAYSGVEAMEAIKNNPVHLALMDIMMPDLDGLSATVKIREQSNVPVILITAKSEDTDKVLGLSLGADDYVTKPFNPVEVIARVKAQLRRYTRLGGLEEASGVLTIGGIELNDEDKTVHLFGEPVSLTPIEYNILKLLMEHPGRVFSSKNIYKQVWNDEPIGAEATVAVHIRHLREKLEFNPSDPRYLKVIWGQGYKIEKGEGV